MTDKKKLIFIMLEWSRDTGRIIRYRYEGEQGESRLSVPDTASDETNAGIVADVFQGDCTFEKGQLVVNPEALKQPPFMPLTPKDFEGSEWVARYGFCDFNDGSPYTPLPAHAAKVLAAAQKRIAELEERHQAATVAFLDANGKGFASGMHYADEKILKLECEIAVSYRRGAEDFAESLANYEGHSEYAVTHYRKRLYRFLASRGTAEAEGEEGGK